MFPGWAQLMCQRKVGEEKWPQRQIYPLHFILSDYKSTEFLFKFACLALTMPFLLIDRDILMLSATEPFQATLAFI